MTVAGCTGSPETDANDGSGSGWRDAHARGGAPRLRGHRHDHFPFLRPRRDLVRTHPSLWRVRIQEAPGGAPPRRSDPLVRSPGGIASWFVFSFGLAFSFGPTNPFAVWVIQGVVGLAGSGLGFAGAIVKLFGIRT